VTRAAWLLCLPILLVAARAEARGCHEVSEIVGKQRCQRFGGAWDVEDVTPWVLSLGPSIARFSEPGVTFAGTVTGPHTAGWPFAVRGADLGRWTSVSPTMRLSFFPVRVLYVGVEGQTGVMSQLPETTAYPGPVPSDRTAVHTTGFSSRSLGSLVGVSLPAWRFDFSAELFSGFRALSLDFDWNNLRGAYAAAGRCQEKSIAMPFPCNCRQPGLSCHSDARRSNACSNAVEVPGLNCTPVATPSDRAASLASITVSAKPPQRATTGTEPYRSAHNCVRPHGSKRDGTSSASAPACIMCASASS